MTKLKYIAAGVLLFMVSFVDGCVGADAKTAEAYEIQRMKRVSISLDTDTYVVKDSETGVYYLATGTGGVCIMVDADGKPLVDKE